MTDGGRQQPEWDANRVMVSRRIFLTIGLGVGASVFLPSTRGASEATVQSSAVSVSSAVLYVVAHEDDSLLFQSPDLVHDVQSGHPVRTVVLTAGDDGMNRSYWSGREEGMRAAYANMAGAANSWSSSSLVISGHRITQYTLNARRNITVNFLRLPDGGYPAGDGSSTYGNESLKRLWNGAIASITAVDQANSYTKASLTSVLTQTMLLDQPVKVSVQDYVGTFGDGDHADHHATAYFAVEANKLYAATHMLTGYADYATSGMAANVTGADLAAKAAAFYAYTPYDLLECQTPSACSTRPESAWLARQYVVGTIVTTVGTAPVGTNVAGSASVTASSENVSTGQAAAKAVDGIIGGYPGDYTREWASVGGRAGTWLKLVWGTPQTLAQVVLFDRPNSDDQVTSGTLTFSDGAQVAVPTLPNDGTGLTVTFSARATTSLLFTVTGVSASTVNVGLSELQAWTVSV